MKKYLIQLFCLTFSSNAIASLDFGLTPTQMESILTLSGGKVDFRNIDSYFSKELSFKNKNINMPPPGIVTVADPALENEWWLRKLKIKEAWEYATGKGITIADCDAGFLTYEPELRPNFLIEYSKDFSNFNDPNTINDGPYTWHGTAVSAILGAVKNGLGTNGIAFDAKIVPLQTFNYVNELDQIDKEDGLTRCILHAINIEPVKIILIENQTPAGSSEVFKGTREAIKLAKLAGITVVSAAGNSNIELKTELEHNTQSIIVGSVSSFDMPSTFSNFGERITISSYGEQIRTLTGKLNSIGSFSGTSAAAPQVAAVVALMLEVNPKLDSQQISDILQQTARETYGQSKYVGGILDAKAAIIDAMNVQPLTDLYDEKEQFRNKLRDILNHRI